MKANEHRYGCNGRERPTAETWFWAQDGYHEFKDGHGNMVRGLAKWVKVYHVMSTDCKYDGHYAGNDCNGCAHKKWGN